jgi:hypothetical protein
MCAVEKPIANEEHNVRSDPMLGWAFHPATMGHLG